MDTVAEILKETDRDNANISNSPSAKMLQIASAASREYYLNRVIPEEMAVAHKRGDIHIHDLDFYGKTLNCLNIPLGRLLHEGFNNGHGYYSTNVLPPDVRTGKRNRCPLHPCVRATLSEAPGITRACGMLVADVTCMMSIPVNGEARRVRGKTYAM